MISLSEDLSDRKYFRSHDCADTNSFTESVDVCSCSLLRLVNAVIPPDLRYFYDVRIVSLIVLYRDNNIYNEPAKQTNNGHFLCLF